MTGIVEKYFYFCRESTEKYGNNSIVLMRVGNFYEMYGYGEYKSAEKIAEILQMQLVLKNGKDVPHSLQNPYMVGFPYYSIHNHIGKLVTKGYTVCIYDEIGLSSGKKDRKLTNVYSPSTYIDETSTSNNTLMSIDIMKNNSFYCEIAYITIVCLSTGNVWITEIFNTTEDKQKIASEFMRLNHIYKPSEIISSTEYETAIIVPIKKEYRQSSYQIKFLSKIYETEIPLESLGLEKNQAVIPCLINGLQYIYDRNPLIVNKLQQPNFLFNNTGLVLNGDSIAQLHITSPNRDKSDCKYTCLIDVLDKTRTPMGSRFLKQSLLYPLSDLKKLNKRYDYIESLCLVYDRFIKSDILLKNVLDIPRKYRRIIMKIITPAELTGLEVSFRNMIETFEMYSDIYKVNLKPFYKWYEWYKTLFNFDELKKCFNIETVVSNIFQKGYCDSIDKLQEKKEQLYNSLQSTADELSNSIQIVGSVKITYTDAGGYWLECTKPRFQKLVTSTCDVSYKTASVRFYTPSFKTTVKQLTEIEEQLRLSVVKEYYSLLQTITDSWDVVTGVVTKLEMLDFLISGARTALEYGYSKPFTVDSERSFIDATDVRHPVVERNNSFQYIPNDVSIGKDQYGCILYGLNMAGKSTYLRSIGCAVVMAQAGLFVAAKSFIYCPFKTCISKITIRDNIWKNQSTFGHEIMEIKDMLLRSDCNSLILSDELCSSTESLSATAIVAAVLNELSAKKTNFFFSTHLHELQHLSLIKDNKNIHINHFKVYVSDASIMYDRKIQPGGINELYGLEIASVLGVSANVIKVAQSIRKELTEEPTEILSSKRSIYNKNVFVHECVICKSYKDLQTHHLQHQCTADDYGLVNKIYNKDLQYNLIVVCKQCHSNIHKK